MLILLVTRKDKQPTERERKETAKGASVHFGVEALQGALYGVGGAVFAVVTTLMGEWKFAAIGGGVAVSFGTLAAVQWGLAREERKRLD